MMLIDRDTHAVLDYTWDWGDEGTWLGEDTISSATVTGTDCTVESTLNTTLTVTAWISGGSTPNPYAVCHIVTAAGREEDRTIMFTMKAR